MLKIDQHYISLIRAATKAEDLHIPLQSAIELEHSTIPPYLTALFSLKPGTNGYVRQILHSIVVEEMLHMTIAANILNALDGQPNINGSDFIPKYPGHLPMGIGQGLIVGLTKYSKDQVKNVFMEIEEPETPLVIPEAKVMALKADDFHTIGEFYASLQEKIEALPGSELPGDAGRQVVSGFFATDQLFPITTKEEAIRAINIIVEQGEGTQKSPADEEGELAHYYKFEELYKGRKIVKDPDSPVGYSFSKEAIPFEEDGVFNIFPDTKSAMVPAGSEERRVINQFNFVYSTLLNGLHKTFNGHPDFLSNTIGLMYDLKLVAEKLCSMPFPGKDGYTIGPSFEFTPINE